MALPQFVLLPKKSELPKIFSGGGGGALPAPPRPQSPHPNGNHALEHNDANTSMPVCTIMYYDDLILANLWSGCPSFLFV